VYSSWIFSLFLAGSMAAVSSSAPVVDRPNLLPVAGFDDFDGSAPRGWTVSSWNQEFLKERFGKGIPGRGDTGFCLEMKEGSGASIIQFSAPVIAVDGDATYFFKGYYASACEKVAVKGDWLDKNGKTLSSFEILLPDTQDQWIHFLKQLSSPVLAQQLRLVIERKWQSRHVRFDDFSLRQGTVADYAHEFDLPDPSSAEPWFPIFSILQPSAEDQEQMLDYVLANFNVSLNPMIGLRYHPGLPKAFQIPSQASQAAAPTEEDTKALLTMDQDPTVWAYWGGDEPHEPAFQGIGQQQQKLRDAGVTKPLWYNLLPTYGLKSYEAYEHHVRTYLVTVKPTFFTYDHYPLHVGNKSYGRDFYANLVIVRRQARAHNIDWGVILLVVAHGGLRSPNEAELRWQAYSGLAYGAKAIGWFTYVTEVEYGGLNWRDAVVNRAGHRTRHYSMLKRLNGDIQQIGKTLIGLQSTGAYHTRPLPELTTSITESKLIRSTAGGPLVIGEFLDDHERPYFMVVNRDFNAPATATIVLSHPAAAVWEYSKTTGASVVVRRYDAKSRSLTVELAPGDGRLFRLQ